MQKPKKLLRLAYFFYMQQLLQLSNVNMERVQAELCPGVQHQDTCTEGRVFWEVQYHRWGVTERLPFGVISVSARWIYFVATCYMDPFNIAWEEVVAGVW